MSGGPSDWIRGGCPNATASNDGLMSKEYAATVDAAAAVAAIVTSYKFSLPGDDGMVGGVVVPLDAGATAYQIWVEAIGNGQANLASAIASFVCVGTLKPHSQGAQIQTQLVNVVTPQTTAAAAGVTVVLFNTAAPLQSRTIAITIDCSSLDNPASMDWVVTVRLTPVTT